MMAFFGCTQAEIEESKAIIPQETEFVLPAAASEQPFTIYADGTWKVDVDVDVDWLTVDPTSGKGTVDVTLKAEANESDEPREAKITIQGSSLMSDVEILITQKMDRFRSMSAISVTDALALQADALAKISDAQVMALTSNGFIISDGASNMFVEGKASVAAGDKLTVTGDVAAINGITALKLDEATVSGNSEVTYPEPKVVDESYVPAKVEYVKVAASYLSGGKLSVNGKQCAIVYKSVKDLSALVGHEVELVGYCVGIDSKLAALVVLSYTDNGKTPIIGKALPFRDNFDWVAPFVQWDKDNGRTTGDSMGSKATVNYGNAYAIPGFEDMFTAQMGYESMFYSSKTVYVCGGNYLKFSKTNNCNGVRLPAFAIEGTDDLRLTFDWGKNDTDAVELEVEIEGKGTINGASKSAVLTVNEGFTWKNEVILINGATSETRICIRPTTYTGAVASDGKLYRWFLDNVEVVSMAGMKEANIEVTGADNNLITFEGLEPEAANLTVTSDSDFTVNCTASWLHLDVTEGLAGEPTAIVVSCDPSDLSVMRKDEITIKSGLSEKKIQVVQSAAGQQLDPLISVICSKPTDALLGEGDEFSVSVQANVDYEVSISDEWIKAVEAPATKASVEKSEHSFTLDVNVSGAPRTGYVRFFDKESKVEAVVVVKQENFVPRIDIQYNHQIGYIPSDGLTFDVHISSNIDFTASSEVITLPVENAIAGEYDITITVPANTGVSRDVKVVFSNEKYGFTKELSINQLGTDVLFADNFDWLKPLIEKYNEANPTKPIGDSVGKQSGSENAPNAYTDATLKTIFPDALNAAGYTDLNKGAKVVYPQVNYLKFAKTDNQTSLQFQPCATLTAATDVTLDFDWCAQIQGNGTVDNVSLVVVISGEGTFENGTKVSAPFTQAQEKGQMYWTHVSTKIIGANSDTKLNIVGANSIKDDGTYNWKVKGVFRWYLDNIVVKSK